MTTKTAPKIEFTSEVVRVTPAMAERWLSKNTNNRNIRKQVVAAYARDMTAGAWGLTGDSIRFGRSGVLLDGQHRLHAVIASGKSVPMLVVRGLDDSVQALIDTGAKRSAGDMLSLGGHSHPSIIAAAGRLSIAIERINSGAARTVSSANVTHSEIASWVESNPDIVGVAPMASAIYADLRVAPSVLAVAILNLARVDRDGCHEFFNTLATHSTAGPGDPRSAYLARLMAAHRQRERLNQLQHLGMIYRAWNAWRAGQTLTKLMVPTSLPKVAA